MKKARWLVAAIVLACGAASVALADGGGESAHSAEPDVIFYQRDVGGLHLEYVLLSPGVPPPPSQLDYVIDGTRLPGGRGIFGYNPAGAPSWAGSAPFIASAITGWNGVSPNLLMTYTGISPVTSSLCNGNGPDGASTITWGGTSGSVIAMACWSGTGECDILLGSNYPTVDMRTVLMHELGHCVGLGHPPDHPEALMYYLYHGPMTGPVADDIAGACSIYGCPPPTPKPSATATPTVRPTPVATPTPPTYRLFIPFVGRD